MHSQTAGVGRGGGVQLKSKAVIPEGFGPLRAASAAAGCMPGKMLIVGKERSRDKEKEGFFCGYRLIFFTWKGRVLLEGPCEP